MSIDIHTESEYNARAAVPEHPSIQADWQRRGEQLRARRACRLNLAYGESERQRIDFFPAATEGAPLHLYLHGGYWQRGAPSAYHFVAESLCARGINVAMAGYDLCPAVSLDTIVVQVRGALAWLWRNAPELGFDRRRIQVCGHSAGGHLTAMLMATDWSREGRDLPAEPIQSGLAISGLYELAPLRHTSINEAVGLDAASAARNSPALLPVGGRAPLTLAVGGLESASFRQQADTLADRWRMRPGGIEVLAVPDTNHFTILEELAGEGALLERALRLLEAAD